MFGFFRDAIAGAVTGADEWCTPDERHRERSPGVAHSKAKGGSGFWTGYSGAKAHTDNNRGANSKAPKRWLF